MLFILIFFFLYSQPIYADDFSLNGDTVNNWYFQTISYSINSIQTSLEYDEGAVLGTKTEDIIDTYTISNITQSANMRRIPGVVDRVAGPPDTKIDILYHYLNDTGHGIDVSKIAIPLSRSNSEMGNISNLVHFDTEKPTLNSVSVLFNGNNIVKEGNLRIYDGIGEIPNGSKGTLLLDSMTISNPIAINSIEMKEMGGSIKIVVEIENKGSEKLNDLFFVHEPFGIDINLEAYSTQSIEYELPMEEDLGSFKIYNDNIKTECVVMGTNYYNWTDTNAVTTLAYREDGGWVYGASVQPANESFCVTRTPYAMTSPNLRYESEIDDGNIEEEEEVLGIEDFKIEILPKTAMKYEN